MDNQGGGGGSRFGVYLGRVVDVRDPEQRGRVRVLVPAINAREILPTWALPRGQSYGAQIKQTGGGRTVRTIARGNFIVPEVDATVYVTFLDGNPELPLWEPGTLTEADVFPDVKTPRGTVTDAYPSRSMLLVGKSIQVLEHELGALDITMKSGREINLTTMGAKLRVRTLPDNPVIVNDGTAAQLAARTGDEVAIGDFTFVGTFNPSNGALTALAITFPDGTTHALSLATPAATFTAVKGTVATGAPKVWIGGEPTRP